MIIALNDPLFLQNTLKSIFLLPYFLLAVFAAFYIPGDLLLMKLNKHFIPFERITVNIIIGLVLWAYQGAFFGFLQVRFMTYVYILTCMFLWLRFRRIYALRLREIKVRIPQSKFFYLLTAIFFFGISGQILKFWIAGYNLSDGIHLFASAGDDAFWHTALNSQLVRRFPPYQPGMVNEVVRNYHYWSNLVVADLVRVFYLPLLRTQFQYVYMLVSFLLGGISFVLARKMNFSASAVAVFVYLQYFSSDTLYIFTYFTSRILDFSIGPLEGGVELLENPPRAFAIIVAYCGILFLTLWLHERKILPGIIAAILFASLIGFKVHTAIPIYFGLAALSVLFVIKKEFKFLLVPVLTSILALFVYLPVNKTAGGLLFTPFWITRDFIVQPGLHLSRLELARQTYESFGNRLQVFRLDMTMLALFLLAQFGLKNIGWFSGKATLKKLGAPLIIFLYSGMFAGLLLGTFFYQKSGGANIFNFFLTTSLLLTIPASLAIGKLLQVKPAFRSIIVVLILALTMPRWIYRNQNLISYFKPTIPIIHSAEIKAMEYIRFNTGQNKVVLVFNEGYWDSRYPYVSAFTNRDMYLSGQWILSSHNITEFKERERLKKVIITSRDSDQVLSLLRKNRISLLYFYGKPDMAEGLKKTPLRKLFENSRVTIFSVE